MLGISRTEQNNDKVFGTVRFRRTFSFFGTGFWESKIKFQPLGKEIEVYIFAGKNGISQPQHDLFHDLERQFNQLIEPTYNILLETPIKYWGNDFFGKIMPELKRDDFRFERIYIPNLEKPDSHLRLSFQYLPMEDNYSVYFENWNPAYGELDEWTPIYGEG